MHDGLQSRLGPFAGHAGREPADHLQPVILAIVQTVPGGRHPGLQGDRHEHVGDLPHLHAMEGGCRDTHDGHRLAVDHEILVQDRGTAAEAARPVTVAQHGDRLPARLRRVVRSEQAAQGGAHSQDIEVVSGHELAVGALGPALSGDAQ